MDDYDEFGNYLGGGEQEEEDEEEEDEDEVIYREDEEDEEEARFAPTSSSIVLFEDRALFPSAESVFGDDVEIVHAAAPASAPPLIPRSEVVLERKLKPKPTAGTEDEEQRTREEQFQDLLCGTPSLVRTVQFCGALHSGKTSLASLLHRVAPGASSSSPIADERARRISLKSRAQSSVQQTSQGKSYLVQSIDSPGHAHFLDQTECGLEIVDAVVLVVDCVEGVQLGTELHLFAIEQFALTGRVVVCINKLDRLVHELKLPVWEASRKIHLVVQQMEQLLHRQLDYATELVFASAEHGWCVSLPLMARGAFGGTGAPDADAVNKLASRLFGDVFYDGQTFSRARRQSDQARRAFDVFVLDPVYKIYSHVLGSDASVAAKTLGIQLSKRELQMDALPLLKACLAKCLHASSASSPSQVLTDLVLAAGGGGVFDWRRAKHLSPSPSPSTSTSTSLVAHLVKFVHPADDVRDEYLDANEQNSFAFSTDVAFRVLGRVYQGTVRVGDEVAVHCSETKETQKCRVTNIRLPLAGKSSSSRLRQLAQASEGMVVLFSGMDLAMTKSATMHSVEAPAVFPRLRLFRHVACKPVCKLALEPLVPTELPKMLAGLRAVQRAYPASRVVVEESGEHVVFGPGELYLDCLMKDLRRFSAVEIKVCDPFVQLCESVLEQSTVRSMAETANKRSHFSVIACPLEPELVRDLDLAAGVSDSFASELLAKPKLLKERYGYDVLASRSVWAFAEDANAFVDDTLGDDGAPQQAQNRDAIVQGFRWAAREGPLCEEQIRGCKFKLLDCQVGIGGAGQIAPTVRRLCHQSMVRAHPVLLEPVMRFDALSTHHGAIGLVARLVQQQRRGGGVQQQQVPGAKLWRITGWLPALDAFGLETELRLKTKGQVFCQLHFDRWGVVPGNVLDDTVQLRPLEPSEDAVLARELVIKTRRRKGLPESLEATSQIDTHLLQEMLARSA